MALFAPLLSPYAFSDQDYSVISCAPSWWPGEVVRCRAGGAHWFGTDAVGRDLFVRTLYGARISLAVGIVATFVSLMIGVLYGAAAGFIGGRVDAAMMRAVDILYSLPFIFFVIILMVIFNQNFILLFVAIGAVSWLTMARIVRGQTLSAKQKEFVEGARRRRRHLRHHHPPYRAQCGGPGDRLCDTDDPGGDSRRKVSSPFWASASASRSPPGAC